MKTFFTRKVQFLNKPTSAFLKFWWLEATLFDLFVFYLLKHTVYNTKIISRRQPAHYYLSYAASWRVHGESLHFGIKHFMFSLRSFRLELLQADLNSLRRISEANSQWAELASSLLEPWGQILIPWLGGKVNYGIGLSYQPASLYVAWRAGTTTLCYEADFIPPFRNYEFGYWSSGPDSRTFSCYRVFDHLSKDLLCPWPNYHVILWR